MVIAAFANTNPQQGSAQGNVPVTVENFGQVNDHIYRGGQPKDETYRQLAAIGIKTIVDLRDDSEPSVRSLAEGTGMRYINLPMAPRQYPQPDAAQRFMEIVNDQANWPVYVHCAGGRRRTGVMIAAYRITVDGWDLDRTYQEMKDYGFYTRLGYGCYKDYVNDFYRNWQATHQTYLATNATTTSKKARLNKVTHLDKVTGVIGRPLKQIYKD